MLKAKVNTERLQAKVISREMKGKLNRNFRASKIQELKFSLAGKFNSRTEEQRKESLP